MVWLCEYCLFGFDSRPLLIQTPSLCSRPWAGAPGLNVWCWMNCGAFPGAKSQWMPVADVKKALSCCEVCSVKPKWWATVVFFFSAQCFNYHTSSFFIHAHHISNTCTVYCMWMYVARQENSMYQLYLLEFTVGFDRFGFGTFGAMATSISVELMSGKVCNLEVQPDKTLGELKEILKEGCWQNTWFGKVEILKRSGICIQSMFGGIMTQTAGLICDITRHPLKALTPADDDVTRKLTSVDIVIDGKKLVLNFEQWDSRDGMVSSYSYNNIIYMLCCMVLYYMSKYS